MLAFLRRWRDDLSLPQVARAAAKADRTGSAPYGAPTQATDPGNARAIGAITDWLCAAQDNSQTQDGGVARDYGLLTGWSASYPETTGYIIPTLIDLGHAARAQRCLDWLVAIQFPEGGFQGGMVNQTPRVPVTFNTGQILLGLADGATRLDRGRYLEPMRRAAIFLRDSQDPDGCWRRHPTPFAAPGEKAYETHVSWGLFEAARVLPDEGFGEAGLRQVDWALTKQLANGWFQSNCLEEPAIPLTHTIGYVMRGLIEAWRWSGQTKYLAAAQRLAEGLLPAIPADGALPGRLDESWRGAVPWVCLTGNAQIAHCLLLLDDAAPTAERNRSPTAERDHSPTAERDHSPTAERPYAATAERRDAPSAERPYAPDAERLLGFVRRSIALEGPAGTRGGIRGSFPIDGDYGRFQYLNWAAKFTIDALRAQHPA